MCGIAGYVQRLAPPDGTIDRMTARLAHRGPDGGGTWHSTHSEWVVALGHRRLAIVDVEGGRQPLSNEDGTVWVTYNGEVYNFETLREDLRRRGHRFATRCDTESVLHHCQEYGPAGLPDLNGMFALAVWDGRKGQLLLARDRAGIKPLYYASTPCGGLVFASELTALLEHPGVDAAPDPAALASFFFSDYTHPPHAMARGARKLGPGEYLLWGAGNASKPTRFWQVPAARPGADGAGGAATEGEVVRRLGETLDAAVASQLLADVPVGVFLSGGLDSSLVAAIAQRHRSHALTTFSIGFADPRFDESGYARRVAQHLGTRHVEQVFSESDLLENLDAALSCLDEPMADPSILPTYVLSKLAAGHVKVALGGDGGDELWGGYPTYKAHRHARWFGRIPAGIRAAVVNPLVARMPVRHGYQSLEWKAKRFALRWADDPRVRHLRWMSNLDLPDLARALAPPPAPPAVLTLPQPASGDPLDAILALDFATYLPGSVLAKVDRAGMAHGLEVRPPMLDNTLIDLAFAVPAAMKLKRGVAKSLLKQAAAGILPRQIIHRRKKGFAIPLARWIGGPLLPRVQDVIASSALWHTGLLNRPVFERFLDEHRTSRVDRSRPLWAMVVLDHWYRGQKRR